MVRRQHQRERSADLDGIGQTGHFAAVCAGGHQPSHQRAARDGGCGGHTHRHARHLRAQQRRQQRQQMRDQPDLREQPQRHAAGQRQEGAIAP
ncbi:hypothetical protein G6F62_012957 [Rhizopus arrhizus]|nr:hypothetical protein G6F62_012957 [Rhizopus arrhizus]